MTSTAHQDPGPGPPPPHVYLGFNSRVVALHRDTGELVWQWRSPQGRSSFVALLLDGDRLMASVRGYTYCLAPRTGEQLWANALPGLGTGIPSMTSIHGSSDSVAAAAAVLAAQQAAAGASGGAGSGS